MAYYPLEIYVIEKENAIFIEYAYNSALYSEYDILYFNNLLNTALLKLNNYMSSILEKVFFCCIGIGATMSAWSQSAVRGRVLDENGQGVDAAVVMLVALPNNILLETALSDGDGRFALHMQEGDFILCVKVLGYKEVKRQISLTGVETLSDIRLEPDEISLNDAIIASRNLAMTSSSNGRIMIHVSQSFLADIGSVLDVLKHSPGISVNNKEKFLWPHPEVRLYMLTGRSVLHGEELSAACALCHHQKYFGRDFPQPQCQFWGRRFRWNYQYYFKNLRPKWLLFNHIPWSLLLEKRNKTHTLHFLITRTNGN